MCECVCEGVCVMEGVRVYVCRYVGLLAVLFSHKDPLSKSHPGQSCYKEFILLKCCSSPVIVSVLYKHEDRKYYMYLVSTPHPHRLIGPPLPVINTLFSYSHHTHTFLFSLSPCMLTHFFSSSPSHIYFSFSRTRLNHFLYFLTMLTHLHFRSHSHFLFFHSHLDHYIFFFLIMLFPFIASAHVLFILLSLPLYN